MRAEQYHHTRFLDGRTDARYAEQEQICREIKCNKPQCQYTLYQKCGVWILNSGRAHQAHATPRPLHPRFRPLPGKGIRILSGKRGN
eukprot:644063-Rhodomonas_salina.1